MEMSIEDKKLMEEAKSATTVINKPRFNKEFTDMRITNVGYGKDEYKTSKPNIVKRDGVLNEIVNIANAMETAIGHTIGPYADDTLIQSFSDKSVPIFDTHDGYTILLNMGYTQAIPQAIFKMLRETSMYMQEKIGDSTSSGIPIQNTLLKSYIEIFNDNTKDGEWKFSPVGLKNISELCAKYIVRGIDQNPKYQVVFPKLTKEHPEYTEDEKKMIMSWLFKVATISANNDPVTADKIVKLFENKLDGRGHVYSDISKTEEEYVEETNAYKVYHGLLDHKKMANQTDGLTCEFENPLIAVFDGRIRPTDLEGLKKIVETAAFGFKRPIVICAEDYDVVIGKYFLDCLQGLAYNEDGQEFSDPKRNLSAKPKKIELAAIHLRNREVLEQMYFDDTCLMTNATPFSTDLTKITDLPDDMPSRMEATKGFFGTCEKVSMGYLESFFIGCKPNKERYDKVVEELNEKIHKLRHVKFHVTNYNQDDIQQRLDRLDGKTTFYYCGGRSDPAKYSRKLVVDDAIAAISAAIRDGGVSIGGNMAISHYINHNMDEITESVLNEIAETRINITAGENADYIKDVIYAVLNSIQYSFGQAYRYALYNMWRKSERAFDKWNECVEHETPSIYNIMSNDIEEFNSSDVEKSTTIMVPRNTDAYLLNIVIERVTSLINIGNMVTVVSPGLDLEAIQIEQMKNGSIFAANNPVNRVAH